MNTSARRRRVIRNPFGSVVSAQPVGARKKELSAAPPSVVKRLLNGGRAPKRSDRFDSAAFRRDFVEPRGVFRVSEWLFTSDLHGQTALYEQVVAIAAAHHPRAVVIGGDLCPHAAGADGLERQRLFL